MEAGLWKSLGCTCLQQQMSNTCAVRLRHTSHKQNDAAGGTAPAYWWRAIGTQQCGTQIGPVGEQVRQT